MRGKRRANQDWVGDGRRDSCVIKIHKKKNDIMIYICIYFLDNALTMISTREIS